MTREKLMTVSDWLWKIMMPVFLTVASFALQSAASELRELKNEISAMHTQIQAISIEVVALRTRFDYHEKISQ